MISAAKRRIRSRHVESMRVFQDAASDGAGIDVRRRDANDRRWRAESASALRATGATTTVKTATTDGQPGGLFERASTASWWRRSVSSTRSPRVAPADPRAAPELMTARIAVECRLPTPTSMIFTGSSPDAVLARHNHMSHTSAPWHSIPFATPRAAAIRWAEAERRAIKRGGV